MLREAVLGFIREGEGVGRASPGCRDEHLMSFTPFPPNPTPPTKPFMQNKKPFHNSSPHPFTFSSLPFWFSARVRLDTVRRADTQVHNTMMAAMSPRAPVDYDTTQPLCEHAENRALSPSRLIHPHQSYR